MLSPAAQATPVTTTFTYTGTEQSYSVPAGTTEVTITAVGAPGFSAGGTGGDGATVMATVPLPSDTTTLYIEVGGAGGIGPCPSVGTVDPPGGGGFNGGGGSGCGGGGGGASDVRLDPSSTTPLTATDSRLVVAGGGGGAGAGAGCGGNGGTAGDTVVAGAGAGGVGNDLCGSAGLGGNGGFQGTSGGMGGEGSSVFPFPGNVGMFGQGGDAPTDTGDNDNFSGGGGGGYYGGGAGGDGLSSGGGAGAGSSFWVANAIADSTSLTADTSGVPEVQITPIVPDLSLSDSAPATVVHHRSWSYSLTATNSGSASATSVTVADILPASVSVVSAQSSQGACTQSSIGAKKTETVAISCAIGTLSGGSTVIVTITVTATTKGTISDSANLTASDMGADNDDSASAPTTVTTP